MYTVELVSPSGMEEMDNQEAQFPDVDAAREYADTWLANGAFNAHISDEHGFYEIRPIHEQMPYGSDHCAGCGQYSGMGNEWCGQC